MRLAIILTANLLASCGVERVATPCGIFIQSDHDVDYARFQELEAQAIAWRLVTCKALDRWTVTVRSEESWDHNGQKVAGLCSCDLRAIEVDTNLWSLTHELAHVSECPHHNYEHAGWSTPDAQGFTTYDRIQKAMEKR